MQVYLYNTYSINTTLLRLSQMCNEVVQHLENGLYYVQFGVFLTKFEHRLLISLSAQSDNV